ncbi:MAG: saccharopine dehydrogenase C-terminal domain-containing protein [Calditrichota bacterium]
MKKALILGAGMVAKPMIDYLLEDGGIEVIIASRTVSKAEKIINKHKNGRAIQILADDDKKLDELIGSVDIAVSLLPYTYHVKIAKICINYGIPLVTTSYVSPQMQELDKEAMAKGVIFLNEIGLDPGIDHMSAMRIIHDVRSRGGYIEEFRSYCGGLPAPEANDNPWGYKFSWSPRGVLMAGRNDAKYLKRSELVEIEGKNLFKNHWPIKIDKLELETYPNRNSLPYQKLYGINKAKTVYRGTLRYPGWCRTMLVVSELGLLTETEMNGLINKSYINILRKILKIDHNIDPRDYIAGLYKIKPDDEIIQKLAWLDIFSEKKFKGESTTPLDFLSMLTLEKLKYQPGERDMIILYHDFLAKFPDHLEKITSTLIDYGIPNGDSSMSRTVSLPAAIAVKLILAGKITETGVRIPVEEEIYHPVLDELEKLGIVCKEQKQVLA